MACTRKEVCVTVGFGWAYTKGKVYVRFWLA